jgi:hypothetical protein
MKKVNNIFNLHDIDIVMHKLYENDEKELRNNILTKKTDIQLQVGRN